jgi:rare lipoprotein A
MPLFGLVWVTSWVSCVLTSSQGLLKVPDYLASAFPSKVFSVINSPIELPTPLFPTQLYSGVWSSNSSVAAVPNLTFQVSAAPFQLRSQLSQFVARPAVGVDAVENTFCPQPNQKEDSVPVTSLPQLSSASWQETSPRTVSKATLPQQIWQVVQNLLPWRQRELIEESIASSVVVASTKSGNLARDKQNTEVRTVKRGFWQYSQRLVKRTVADRSPTEEEQFQVWVKKRLIAQFPSQQQAELMAQRLKQFSSDSSDPGLRHSPVEPVLFEGLPTVKIGDRLLFQIDDTLAKALNRNPELLAIEWANNLRIAVGQIPLPLAEAQRRMYNLVETSSTFQGRASWYGPSFHGRLTATGETYNQHELTAAHPSLPFDTYLKVRNRQNGNSVIVRINDRGPYVPDRTLDLSREAARCLNSEKVGVVPFEAVILQLSTALSNGYISQSSYLSTN